MLLSVFAFLLTLSMIGLTISNLVMIGKNITQIDMLKGNFKFSDHSGTHPNPFDLGFLTNINLIF
jgi:hypothetical protein